MLTNQYEVEKYIKVTADRANLKVVWNDEGIAATDGKTVWLPKINGDTTQEQADAMISLVAHEATHVLHSDFALLRDKQLTPDTSFLGAVLNAIEDDGVDAINASQFAGDRMVRNDHVSRLVEGIAANLDAAVLKNAGKPLNSEAQKMISNLVFSVDGRSDIYPSLSGVVRGLEKHLDEEGKGYVKKLIDGNYAAEVRKLRADHSTKRTEGAYKLARRIIEEVYNLDADEEEQKAKAAAQAKADAKGEGAGEGKKGEKGKGKGKGAGKDGKDPNKALFGELGKPDGDGEMRTEDAQAIYKFFTEDTHEEFIEQTVKGANLHITYNNDRATDAGSYSPTPLNDTIIINYPTGKTNYPRISADANGARSGYADIATETDGFANKVRRLVQIRARDRMQYGTKKGRLHAGAAYRVVLKNAPGFNEKVFKKPIVSETLDSAVMVLGDISGSMSGSKMEHQISAFLQLNQAIGNALHIPVAMVGFTEHSARNAMFIWRRFEDNTLSNEKLKKRMLHSAQYMSQNCDGDSILYGYTMLKQRKEKRKILLVLSDGSPASSKRGDVDAYTAQLIAQLERDRSVDIYAIGILDDNVKRLYKNHRVIGSATELESALLSIIERKLV